MDIVHIMSCGFYSIEIMSVNINKTIIILKKIMIIIISIDIEIIIFNNISLIINYITIITKFIIFTYQKFFEVFNQKFKRIKKN